MTQLRAWDARSSPILAQLWSRRLAGGSALASLVIVTAIWLHGGAVAAVFSGGADAVTSLSRLTGLLGADLLLLQVASMARIPWLERMFGQDLLARWHRIVGFTSIVLVAAHVILVTIGYAGTGHDRLLGEAWTLLTTYPGMLLAAAGTAALAMVAVTSVRAARRRLRYESWHLLHLYAYLGVGLALPHQLWTGADFVTSPLTRAYWWTIYAAVAASVIIFRIGVPVWRSVRLDLRVAAVVPESSGVHSVYIRGAGLSRLPVQAGQFFTWRFLHGPGWMRGHPFSLSAAPRHDMLRITVKDLGDGSRLIARLKPGTRVLAEGPFGRLTGSVRRRHRLTLIASGIGITPLRALLEAEYYQPGEATLIYRTPSLEQVAFVDELDTLARTRGVRLAYLSGRRGPANSWIPRGYGDDPDELLRELVPEIHDSDVYVCGPEQWMAAVRTSALRAGVPAEQIHLERFAW